MSRKTILLTTALATGAAIAVLVPAAGRTAPAPPLGASVSAGPAIQAPPAGVSHQADAAAFFPREVTIHVGDSVTWHFDGFHTVTFPGLKKPYPFIVGTPAKQPRRVDGTGSPYWWAGKAPVLQVSPLSLLPQGSLAVAAVTEIESSGLLRVLRSSPKSPPPPYSLTFTKPGVYRYQCAVHPGMRGVVRVVPAGASIPTAAEQAQAAKAELAKLVSQWKQLAPQAPATKNTVWVGSGTRDGASLDEFFPKVLQVKVGDSVTFVAHDPNDVHTITFGPAKLRSSIEKSLIAPQGNPPVPTFNPLGAYPSEPGKTSTLTYDGSTHGDGYLNSGLLSPAGVPGGPHVFQVRFTKPGIYHYECVVHPNMDGTIIVE